MAYHVQPQYENPKTVLFSRLLLHVQRALNNRIAVRTCNSALNTREEIPLKNTIATVLGECFDLQSIKATVSMVRLSFGFTKNKR